MFTPGDLVECDFGYGDTDIMTVVRYNPETDILVVEDEDGNRFKGWADNAWHLRHNAETRGED